MKKFKLIEKTCCFHKTSDDSEDTKVTDDSDLSRFFSLVDVVPLF